MRMIGGMFKEYINSQGEVILYRGSLDFEILERVSLGPGDIWHSGPDQGFRDAFPEIVYQTAVFFWYLNDFKGQESCISWRMNSKQFAIRKKVWEHFKGFDPEYENENMQGLDFAYNALRNGGAIPLYIKGLFKETRKETVKISTKDRYVFFRKNYKTEHSLYMLFRKGLWKPKEWQWFIFAQKHYKKRAELVKLPPRQLLPITGKPTVSYIIPTMFRQEFTFQLLEDLKAQTHPPTQVIVVDATPSAQRDDTLYEGKNYPFKLQVHWQNSSGSCRARNEAIGRCTSDYIIFGDDDIRVPQDFIAGHLSLLQTYNAGACNGLDIRADHQRQNLEDLNSKLKNLGIARWYSGAANSFSNANSCVKREHVNVLQGNDINFDGGYGEDSDFGLSLVKMGVTVLHNPFSANLHLKPHSGGYRWWGTQSKLKGASRKTLPWELDVPVKWVRPVPSPTVMYGLIKHFTPRQLKEYRNKYFFLYLFKKSKVTLPFRLLRIPYKFAQFRRSIFYAKKLMQLGPRHK